MGSKIWESKWWEEAGSDLEDFGSGIPIVGPLLGLESDEQKALVAKQQQLAREAKLRRAELDRQNLNSLGQSMLAFSPHNQVMSQIYGPQAAFSQTQMSAMIANPKGMPEMPQGMDQTSTDPRVQAEQERVMRERDEWRANEERRRKLLEANFAPPAPGPAPLDPRRPAPARRY